MIALSSDLIWSFCVAYFSLEVCFFFVWLCAYYDAQKLTEPEKYHDRDGLRETLRKYASQNLPLFFGWFRNEKKSDKIGLLDLRVLYSWAIFAKHEEDLLSEEREIIGEDVNYTLNNVGSGTREKIIPGRHMGTCLRHTLYSLNAYPYPLLFYCVIFSLNVFFKLILRTWGFTRVRHGRLTYWKRMTSDATPVIFLHGLGIGLAQYFKFILSLSQSNDNLLIFEFPWVAMSIPYFGWVKPLGREEFLKHVREIHERENIEKAKYISHSYGTFIAAWVILGAPDLISDTVLMDPVTLYICMPITSPRALFSSMFPNTSHPLYIIFGLVIYFVTREIGIARTLYRHFWWYNVNITADNLPSNAKIVLHEGDELVPVKLSQQILSVTRPDVQVLNIPTLTHAGFLYHYPSFTKVMNFISRKEQVISGGPEETQI